jgi:hypothetical protein
MTGGQNDHCFYLVLLLWRNQRVMTVHKLFNWYLDGFSRKMVYSDIT